MKTAVIIGCGQSGSECAENLAAISDKVKITGFCDLIINRANKLAEKFGGEAFSDYRKMYDTLTPDMAFICTPPYSKKDVETDLVNRNIPFMTELPLALNISEAENTLDLIKNKGVIAACRCENLNSNLAEVARRFAKRNAVIFAESEYITPPPNMFWKRDEELSGGILLEKGCEALEILRSFFGDAVSYSSSSERGFVSGMADYNTDDIFSALVRFSSGATAEILCGNFGDTDCGLRFKLYAPGKRLEYTRDEVRIYGETFDPGKTKKMLHAGEILPDEVTDECLIYKRNPAVSAESAFVSAVENNLPELAADYEKGLETLKLAMKMRKGTL